MLENMIMKDEGGDTLSSAELMDKKGTHEALQVEEIQEAIWRMKPKIKELFTSMFH